MAKTNKTEAQKAAKEVEVAVESIAEPDVTFESRSKKNTTDKKKTMLSTAAGKK